MTVAFQRNAFQNTAFQIISTVVTDTQALQLPVDCVMAGEQLIQDRGRTFEPGQGRGGEKVTVRASHRARLSNAGSSFTTRTDKRGYS